MRVRAIFWLVWAGLGVLLEAIALANGPPGDTLTETILSHIPAWLVFAGLGWALYHFIVSYRDDRG